MKRKKLLGKLLSLAIVTTLSLFTWTSFVSANTIADLGGHLSGKSDVTLPVPSYDSVFKIPTEAITSITNNAGNYGGSVIGKAIDGIPATHWETNRPNTNTFHNRVTVTFDDMYLMDRINYLVRQDGAKPKGFPLAYNVYYSTTETGDNFQLLKEGSFASASGNTVTIGFDAVKARRITFEFVTARDGWASIAEIGFYKPDALAQKMDELFTDKTYSALKDEYKNEAILDEMTALAAKHPSRNQFMPMLQDAKTLLQNPKAFEETVFTASQRGNMVKEKQRTKVNTVMYAFDPTGYYVTPGETIQVYVEADPNSIMPQLVFGQIAKDKNDWRRWFDLKPGLNTITAQTQDKMNPAAIYISNYALPEDQAYAPKIRIVGGTKFPMYVHGETSTAEFKAELKTFLENVSYNDTDFANGNPNGYYYNIAEITSENNIISTTASGAYKEVQALLGKDSSVEEAMDHWEGMYYDFARYSGFEMEDETSPNYRPRCKFMSRVFAVGPFGWADYGYTGYCGGDPPKRDTGFYSSIISSAANAGWAIPHEWGHMYDSNLLGRAESTNNLYSLMLQDKVLSQNRMVSENRWEIHFTNYHNTKQYPDDQLFYGAIVYQLRAIYGEDLYGRASKIARENKDNILSGCTNNNDRLAVCLSIAAGTDLTSHFDYYKETVSEAAKGKVAHLPKPDKKLHYVNNKSFEKDATTFANPNVKPTITASGNNQIQLTLAVEETDKALLCFEVYRDNAFLGVTYGKSFVDKTCKPNTDYTYSVIAYDRQLNPSLMSNSITKNSSEPKIIVNAEEFIGIHQEFDPLKDIDAQNAKGEDISANLRVTENNVDVHKKGSYSVSYTVNDALGNATALTRKVSVISTYEYLSDLQQTSATTEWGKLGKDVAPSGAPIRLISEGKTISYAKGLGVHAKSKVVYNVEGKNYAYFTSFIGMDQSMAGNKSSSAGFEVWVDGEKQYHSSVMKINTSQQYVKVDIRGAKEVMLITNDGGNGNAADHTVWADAKFIKPDSAPVISAKNMQIEKHQTPDFMKNATATDVEDGDMTSALQVTTDYVPNTLGEFTVTYTATDADGNTTSKSVTLTVVKSTQAPVLKGQPVATVLRGEAFQPLDYVKAFTYEGKDISDKIQVVSSNVNAQKTGNYQVVYSVIDGEGRDCTKEMAVNVVKAYTYASDIQQKSATVEWGSFRKDTAPTGSPITLITAEGNKVYNKGLGAHAKSQIVYNVEGKNYDYFESYIGIDQSQVDSGYSSAGFEVWVDGERQYNSNVMKLKDNQVYVKVDIRGAKEVTLITNTGGNNNWGDQTVWADAKFVTASAPIIYPELAKAMEFAEQMTDKQFLNPALSHGDTIWANLETIKKEADALLNRDDASTQEVEQCTYLLIYFIEETGQVYDAETAPLPFS